jgi:hypothetical protein
MSNYVLSLGKVNVLSKNLAEVIVDEGIIIDEIMVDEYHDFLLNNLDTPFSLLVNKKNSYTYTFGAQKVLLNIPQVKSIAILTSSIGAVMATETLMSINTNMYKIGKIFQDRQEALAWVHDNHNS